MEDSEKKLFQQERKGNPSSIVHKVVKFNEEESIKLIQVVNLARQDFQIQIDFIPNPVDLMTFLQSTCSTLSKLNLTVDKIRNSNFPPVESPNLKFPQLRSLNFLSLRTNTQLECLIRIFNHSPNLRQISIGHFDWNQRDTIQNSSNVITFLNSVSLKNVEFSCGLIENEGFNVDLLKKLKGNGVSINKLGFNGEVSNRNAPILEYLNQDLQEIHLLYYTKEGFPLKCPFINLKVLGVTCADYELLRILRSCPNLQQLKWFADRPASISKNEDPFLPHLTSLTLSFFHENILKFAIDNLSNCPNLNELTIVTQSEVNWLEIYKTFVHIKKLRLISTKGISLENLTGVKKESLKEDHWDSSFHHRPPCIGPPYIGNLKELTSLSFGHRDYRYSNLVSEWNLDLSGWADGICHLPKLTHLQLPPITMTQATSILDVLSSHSKQLKLVEIQVWFGKEEGRDGTMTKSQVDQLSFVYNKQFKIKGIRLFPYMGNRYYYF